MFSKTNSAAVLLCGSLLTGAAFAQEVDLGKETYMDRCAVCHGETGQVDGMVGALFEQKPKDLTLLAKENGGAFPAMRVYQSIDGRAEIAGHDWRQMPVWGEYFMTDAIEDRNINPKDAQHVTQGRILAVRYYLESIQQQ